MIRISTTNTGKDSGVLERLGTVAIIGVGLIGGSIGQALRTRGLATRVVGIGRDEARLAEAVQLGAIDAGTTQLHLGVTEADVVVVCTPVTRIADDVCEAVKFSPKHVLVTDAGSTKQLIVEAVERNSTATDCFVGGHPIAGSERKGVAFADPDLFEGRACILTPTEKTSVERLERARTFWSGIGCRLLETSPQAHDSALALTSHLPHAVAAALAGSIPNETLPMAAGAYRDGTRVAGSDATLWAGIFRANRAPILEAIGTFRETLSQLESALEADDQAGIIDWWNQARSRRATFDSLNDPASNRR